MPGKRLRYLIGLAQGAECARLVEAVVLVLDTRRRRSLSAFKLFPKQKFGSLASACHAMTRDPARSELDQHW